MSEKILSSASILLLCFLFAGCAEWELRRSAPQAGAEQMAPTAVKMKYVPDGYYETVPPLPKKGYFLEKLGKGVYFFSNGFYNNVFIVTPEGVVITDPFKGWGAQLQKAIREVTALPVKFIIYSHAHLDHIGDAHLFAAGAQVVAHNETARLLRRYNDPGRPVPHIGFAKNYSLTLGGTKIELIYPGHGHGHGNIMIYLPQSKVLMFVDVAAPKAVPAKNFATSDIFAQMASLKKALRLEFDVYVAGHYHRPGKRREMVEVLNYYQAVRKANIAALSIVKFKDVAEKSRSKDLLRRMAEYRNAVAEACHNILRKQWGRRLMGFAAFARSHCDTWTSYHKTEKSPAVKQ